MRKYFNYDTIINDGLSFTIRPNFETIPINYTTGSFNILPARLLGLSYAQYLRFCRDICGAKIIGKNRKYPLPYFKLNSEFHAFLDLLNKRMDIIVAAREQKDKYLNDREDSNNEV